MKCWLEKKFGYKDKGSSLKTELIGGLITFIAMIYILPVNSEILGAMGMNQAGVFCATALVSGAITIFMGLYANYPVALSAGMGMNAYLAYTICRGPMNLSWQESMLLLFVAGILFFVLSLTPIRQKIIENMPSGMKYAISAGLGAFILFVGMKTSGIIANEDTTLVTLGSFKSPAVILALFGILLVLGLMAVKKKAISRMAIPIGLLVTAIIGVVITSIAIITGNKEWAAASNLPIAPWYADNISWGASGLGNVMFFGYANGSNIENFGDMLVRVFSKPQSYVAIFALIFINLFDTTATLVSIGTDCGFINREGKMIGGNKATIADATGALICAPLGTSTVTSFAESGVGVSLGSRTGLSAVTTGIMFLLAAFLFPVFSIFSYSCVTALALVAVGLIIIYHAMVPLIKEGDFISIFSGILMMLTMMLTYSLSNGLGIGLIAYIIMMLCAGRHKELNIYLYVIAALFVADFALSAVVS